MAHRELFVRDLKQWLSGIGTDFGERTPADSYAAETLNALRSILIEIEQSAVFVAITTSIAGALLDQSPALTPQHLSSYRPPNPNVYRAHIDGILEGGVDPAILLPVQAYHTRLTFALRLTRAIVDAGPAPTHNVRGCEYQNLEEAWQHVCGMALVAISTLREVLASVRFSRPPVSNEHAEALLRSAKAGGRPCIGKDGSVTMPRWAESRMHQRHVTRQVARLFAGAREQEVMIENVSRSGFGLSGVEDCAAGQAVSIQVQSGERLKGRVMWSRDGRAGIQFETPLPAAHPLVALPAALHDHDA